MENFIFQNETKIIFGKDTELEVGVEVSGYGKKILFHYGGGSIKRTGLYDKVVQALKDNAVSFIELSGVKPLDDAFVAEADADAGFGAEQAALADRDLILAAARQRAHDRRSAADVAAVADDHAGRDAAFDHRRAERAGVEVDEPLVHHRGARRRGGRRGARGRRRRCARRAGTT